MKSERHASGRRTAGLAAVALASAWVLAGCEVVNPGPVDDDFIDDPTAQAGLINGSWERMNNVIGGYTYNTALAAREVFNGGQTGSYSVSSDGWGGWTQSGPYNASQQARWVAEEAIRRFAARGDVGPGVMVQAYLAAGWANKMNGDYFCWGVIDGGKLFAGTEYFKMAEAWFTKALSVATNNNDKLEAYAGRAASRLWLKDYAGAVADAKQVPTDFVKYVEMDFARGGVTGQANHVMWAQGDQPFRSWTTLYTYYHDYYSQTGDPRVPWRKFPTLEATYCLGGLSGYSNTGIRAQLGLPAATATNNVPCFQQQKYKSRDDDIRIASGQEMRLLEAEAILRTTPANYAQAMQIVNALRTSYVSQKDGKALPAYAAATSLDQAWTYYMRERSFETYLEGRRFSDMRRWEPYLRQMPSDGATLKYGQYAADGTTLIENPQTTPGTLDWPNFEAAMSVPTNNVYTQVTRGRAANPDFSQPRELCYNVSDTERSNNPNLKEQIEP
jgi:starch-binding outer membrane protein, SusD/RagB family